MSTSEFNVTKFTFGDSKKKDLVFLARAAETAERYEDMRMCMKALVEHVNSKADLDVEERNLLSVAYKNVVGARRASWRTLNLDEYKDNELIKVYKHTVENELEAICNEIIKLLKDFLIPFSHNKMNESEVFYLKMAGDYFRYLAEFVSGKNYDVEALNYYKSAFEIAQKNLQPTHPIRLGLALNYSVCFYEIAKDQKQACDMAKHAFDEAISKLDQLDEASYKDSTLIMQLLRDNLTLWTSENDANEEDS
jgi:hypothetical protein